MALRSELKQKITALLESGAGATTDQFDDSYHLGAVLGEGGYAKVYKCTHKSSGADRAVKVTTKGGHHKECAIARAEADILSSLSHSHIIDIYDFYENPTSIHLVMELVEGGELFYKIVDLKHYTEETASRLMKNVLSGVAFMHQSGVAHRDLKPENLLLVGTKDIGEDVEVLLTKIKICDFGFAKRFTAGASEFHEGNIGTHAYQAPELIRICTGSSSAPYNERCDVWSLGVICYILLCGAFPFDVRPPVHELNRKICTGAYSFNKPAFSTVTQEGKDFISALLTVDPAKRPTAADALQHGWITGTPELALNASFSSANLSETIEELKRFNALQKFRGTVQAVFAMNRMQKLLGAEMRQAARTIQRKWKSKAAGPGSPTSAPAPAAAVPEPEPEPPAPSETSTPGASEAVEGAGAPAASGAAPGSAADGPAGADYKTWKVDELRRALKQRGLPVGGLKHVLAKRLREDDEAQRSPKKARKS